MQAQEKIKITPLAQAELSSKQKELEKELAKTEKKEGDLLSAQKLSAELAEVKQLLLSSEIVEFSEKDPAVVLLGTRITLENLKSGDLREYTILTRSTANPLKGVISNESPLAQKVLGLKLGNTFKFRDISGQEETFKIKTIE